MLDFVDLLPDEVAILHHTFLSKLAGRLDSRSVLHHTRHDGQNLAEYDAYSLVIERCNHRCLLLLSMMPQLYVSMQLVRRSQQYAA